MNKKQSNKLGTNKMFQRFVEKKHAYVAATA